jgi:hypothetical protein
LLVEGAVPRQDSEAAAADGSPAASPAAKPPATIPADPAAALASAKARLGTEFARSAQDMGSDVLSYTGIGNAETRNWEISNTPSAGSARSSTLA